MPAFAPVDNPPEDVDALVEGIPLVAVAAAPEAVVPDSEVEKDVANSVPPGPPPPPPSPPAAFEVAFASPPRTAGREDLDSLEVVLTKFEAGGACSVVAADVAAAADDIEADDDDDATDDEEVATLGVLRLLAMMIAFCSRNGSVAD